MIKELIRAYKQIKADKKKTPAAKVAEELLHDPLSLELIAKMAKNIDRGFEIVRPVDGVILRFYDKGFQPVSISNEREVW